MASMPTTVAPVSKWGPERGEVQVSSGCAPRAPEYRGCIRVFAACGQTAAGPRRSPSPLLKQALARGEAAEFVGALLDDAVAGLRERLPGALQLAERLGDDQPGLLGQAEQ